MKKENDGDDANQVLTLLQAEGIQPQDHKIKVEDHQPEDEEAKSP